MAEEGCCTIAHVNHFTQIIHSAQIEGRARRGRGWGEGGDGGEGDAPISSFNLPEINGGRRRQRKLDI